MAALIPKGATKPIHIAAVELNGGVDIRVVNEKGEPESGGLLLHIFNDGSVFRYGSIHKRHGLKIDAQGQLPIRF